MKSMHKKWAGLAALIGLMTAANLSHAQQPAHRIHVDCSRSVGGDGSLQAPLNTLAALNALSLAPGDTVLLRRGSSCPGTLMPQGSGTEAQPIRLSAYGEGARPRIVADQQAEEALKLFNQQYWDIDSLDIAGGTVYGVFISGDKGVLHHIHLANLAVHDVMGAPLKHKESGLISISPSHVDSHFDDVLVEGVEAWHTNQWVGIMVGGGNIGFAPESVWNTHVVVRNSAIHDVQGDGIVLFRVRDGLIDSSVAWSIGMQQTQTTGTPNAIWTWMCNDCTVRRSEGFLTDSPGVDGGAFDVDYGNTKNVVEDSYGHDTQGYCVSVFGAGGVTHDSVVRGNLCINNARSPRMADFQGAIFVWTWDGGSIDGVRIEKNTVYWNPYENRPAMLNRGAISAGPAVFSDNLIYATAPALVESNAQMALAGNTYHFFGAGPVEWTYAGKRFDALAKLQGEAGQETGAHFERHPLKAWAELFPSFVADQRWTLDVELPLQIKPDGLLDSATQQPLVLLESALRQYAAQGLRMQLTLTAADPQLFKTEAFRNLLKDLDLPATTIRTGRSAASAARIVLRRPNGQVAERWAAPLGPAPLGLALRKAYGEPVYAQMPEARP
jgi:hypothetical protein